MALSVNPHEHVKMGGRRGDGDGRGYNNSIKQAAARHSSSGRLTPSREWVVNAINCNFFASERFAIQIQAVLLSASPRQLTAGPIVGYNIIRTRGTQDEFHFLFSASGAAAHIHE